MLYFLKGLADVYEEGVGGVANVEAVGDVVCQSMKLIDYVKVSEVECEPFIWDAVFYFVQKSFQNNLIQGLPHCG